jgi:LysM repeat protein
MERAERMKTATTPLSVRSKATALAILLTSTLATLSVGFVAFAQDEPQRTVATGSGIPLAQDAPDRYTVKHGDTLWDIAKVFLRDPWYWPEIWYVNPQVKNPHLIYPGDVLVLVKGANGEPQVTIAERGPEGAAADRGKTQGGPATKLSPQIRSTPLTAAVTTIPYDAVAAFLGRPSLLSEKEVKTGPYVVAMRDQRVVSGAGDEIYARGVKDAAEDERFSIIQVDEPLIDPENGKMLGYRGIYAGTGSIATAGDPAKLRVRDTQREVLRGDKLFPEHVAIDLDFLPHPPATDIRGSVMAVSGLRIAAAPQVVAINRGGKHGLDPGTVLSILQRGEVIVDRFSGGSHTGDGFNAPSSGKVKLPDERIGVVMVFKTYENMSFALIMDATHPVGIGDIVRTP